MSGSALLVNLTGSKRQSPSVKTVFKYFENVSNS